MCLSQYEVQQGKQEIVQSVKHWRIPLLQLQELPKTFGWDPMASMTTPVLWHIMQKIGQTTQNTQFSNDIKAFKLKK